MKIKGTETIERGTQRGRLGKGGVPHCIDGSWANTPTALAMDTRGEIERANVSHRHGETEG